MEERACPACGHRQRAAAKFCDECGQPLAAAGTAAAATEVLPSAFGGGRYRVAALLGEGTRKRVYRARDTRLDREVAIAEVKTRGLDAAERARVLAEARALAALGDHPNVVAVYDVAEEGEQLFFVLQYMPAGSLADRVGPARPLALDEARRVGREISLALEYTHARGVVHRDLKPANVWLAADGTAKLGDFGLALSAGDAAAESEHALVGTAAYMAPEQAMGQVATPQSDLYSLGCMLYEMVTGSPPFGGDDHVSIIGQQLHAEPVAPSWHRPELPAALESLILRLLAKEPEKRPASAASVAAELAALELASAAPVPKRAEANPLDRLATGIFVGREPETEVLRALLHDALAGRGRLATLVGEPGIGKTRTAEELATYARLRGAEVLVGRCYEGEGAPALWPWVQIVRAYAERHADADLAADMGAGAADIAEVVREIRDRLPDLPPPPRLDPEEARFRFFDSVTKFLHAAARRAPLVLVLDDLHWADRASLLLLQFFARALAAERVLVLATYRDVELGRHHPLAATLAELARIADNRRVLLRGLNEAEVGRFLTLSAGIEPPASLVAAIFRETEGNPFFVREVVSLLAADGRLARAERTRSWSLDIPQGVRQVVGQRLSALTPECNRILAIGAVIGREFEQALVEAVAESDGAAVSAALEQASAARVVHESKDSLGRYRFSHALVRETLYDELRTVQRVRLHRRIGEEIERRYTDAPEAHLAELAYHYCEAAAGGDVAKAVEYGVRAAEQADRMLAFDEAADHYERALQVAEDTGVLDRRAQCELLLKIGDSRARGSGPVPAMPFTLRAFELARSLGSAELMAQAALGLVTRGTPFNQETLDVQTRVTEEALAALGPGDSIERVKLMSGLANTRFWVETDAQIAERCRLALEMADRLGDPAAGFAARELRAVALAFEFESPRERFQRAVELLGLAKATGQKRNIAAAYVYLHTAAVANADAAEVDRILLEFARLSSELRDGYSLCSHGIMRASRAIWQGSLDVAEGEARKAMEIRDSEAVRQTYATVIGLLRRLQGRLAEIVDRTRSGVERFPHVYAYRAHLACQLAELGRLDDARAELARMPVAPVDTWMRRDTNSLMNLALLADAVVLTNFAPLAESIYAALTPFDGGYTAFTGATTYGAVGRHLGNLDAVLGRFDRAEAHFEAGLEVERRMRAPTWEARLQIDYARMLVRRRRGGDRERALVLLDDALRTSGRHGLKAWTEAALALKLTAQGADLGDLKGSLHAVAASIEAHRPELSGSAAADGSVTLMFSDMEGFTEMTERLGDREAYRVVQAHNAIVREQLAVHGGRELELQGDGFLLAFGDPGRAVRCAVAIERGMAAYSAAHPEQPIRVRIGLHMGEALRDRDKFFGRTVILAARIAAQARGGEVLVSASLREHVAAAGLRIDAGRLAQLKGIAEPQPLFAVEWAADFG